MNIDRATSEYVERVRRVPKMSLEEEKRMCELWYVHGNSAGRDRLIENSLRIVTSLAIKYRRYGIYVDDLISEGTLGLYHAIEKFEPARGYRFSTYSVFWVRAYMLRFILESHKRQGGSAATLRSALFWKFRREVARAMNLHCDRDAVVSEVANRLKMKKEKVESLMENTLNRETSTETVVSCRGDDVFTLGDSLISNDPLPGDELEELGYRARECDVVRYLLSTLREIEKQIIEKKVMSNESQASIGRGLGVSRERVRQLRMRSIKKLRKVVGDDVRVGVHEYVDGVELPKNDLSGGKALDLRGSSGRIHEGRRSIAAQQHRQGESYGQEQEEDRGRGSRVDSLGRRSR